MPPLPDPYGLYSDHPVLDAEVARAMCAEFEADYFRATGQAVTPGNPPDYMVQDNKWGRELRVYFNAKASYNAIRQAHPNLTIENNPPYHGTYQYRINTSDFWWELVLQYGFRLGLN